MAKYKNKLGLEGIPRIKEIIPQNLGFFFGLFYTEDDEFIHFADTLKDWKRQGKCLADYIQDERHQQDVLRDLYRLRDDIDFELRERKKLSDLPYQDKVPKYFERREFFLRETFPYEESKLLAWEAPVKDESIFDLIKIGGQCIITREDGAVTKVSFQFYETSSAYRVFWKSSTTQETDEGYKIGLSIGFKIPKTSGELVIIDKTRGITERVPFS